MDNQIGRVDWAACATCKWEFEQCAADVDRCDLGDSAITVDNDGFMTCDRWEPGEEEKK